MKASFFGKALKKNVQTLVNTGVFGVEFVGSLGECWVGNVKWITFFKVGLKQE